MPVTKAVFAALGLVSAITLSQAKAQSPNDRLIASRAVEAVIWGMPAVNYDLMRQQMLTKTSGKVGQVIYWGRPLDSSPAQWRWSSSPVRCPDTSRKAVIIRG